MRALYYRRSQLPIWEKEEEEAEEEEEVNDYLYTVPRY